MKKILFLLNFMFAISLFSSSVLADDDDWGRGYGWGGHHEHRHHHHHHGGWGGYGRPNVNNYYYPQPQANYYPPQPPVAYYPPQQQYYGGYDGRSHQGLAGGVVGTVFGYELGNGNPLAAGIGAAAGSFLGNGAGWRY